MAVPQYNRCTDSISMVKRRNLTSDPRRSNAWWSESNLGQILRKSKKSKSHPLRKIVLYLLWRRSWKMIQQAQKGLRRRVNQRVLRPRILFLRHLRHLRRPKRYGARELSCELCHVFKIFQKVSPDGLRIYEQVSTTLCTYLTLNSPRRGDS